MDRRHASHEPGENYDSRVIADFGSEWQRFDQRALNDEEARRAFHEYFAIFPWDRLPRNAVGFDAGCGSGRWARLVAPRVGTLHCIDGSEQAVLVASRNLREFANCHTHLATIDSMPLPDESMDFGYSLGVLHHVPDTLSALRACVVRLKPGAPFLLYLYYAFDNKPAWFRMLWKSSEVMRLVVSRSPFAAKAVICDIIAATVYWPLARIARFVENTGRQVENFPLSAYRHRSFYGMRTDALDRFGTRVEKRFTRAEIQALMTTAGLTSIRFHEGTPRWVAVGTRSMNTSSAALRGRRPAP